MFDLFEALAELRKAFGEDSELLLRNDNAGIAIRIQVFKFGEWHHQEVIITHAEMDTDLIRVAGLKWRRAIEGLERYLKWYKPPPK